MREGLMEGENGRTYPHVLTYAGPVGEDGDVVFF